MELTLCFYAALRERAGAARWRCAELPEPLSVAALKRELERRHPELGSLTHVRAVLGNAYVPDETPLVAGQEVHLLPPVSGGQAQRPSFDRFLLSAEPLDPAAWLASVAEPGLGGQCLFVGSVRDRNRGREVARIDYEAFESMAGPEMERIFAECRSRFDPDGRPERRLRLAVAHRIGPVEVGEPAVVVAVASPHRDNAFEACRFLIDTLKERLPIWKHERYPDGSCWIGDRP